MVNSRNYLLMSILLVVTFILSTAQAQNVDVIVSPDDTEIQVGESLKLDVFAYSSISNTPVDYSDISWTLTPDSLATITDDGFFIAGKQAGSVVVKASVVVNGITIVRNINIRIGNTYPPFFNVKVVPENAVVPSGSVQQFHVVINSRLSNVSLRPNYVRWQVIPEDLGKIDSRGLFTAGDQAGQGKVVAIVEIDGLSIRAAANVTVSPPATGGISGEISKDSDGLGLAGAVIRAVRLGSLRWFSRAESDSSGKYVLTNLIPGTYVLFANARGYIAEFYDDTRNYLEATPIGIAENDSIPGIDFSLSKGGKIKGTVISEADSLPIPNAHVVSVLVVNPKIARHTTTDDHGNYTLESLPTGSYAVGANTAGYHAEFFDDVDTIEEATYVSVTEPDSVEDVDFALARTSAISGAVISAANGKPISGAKIHVLAGPLLSVNQRVFRQSTTDDNGEYLIQIPRGEYYVYATAEGFNGEYYDDAKEFADATLVPVFADSHTTGIDFALSSRGSISGIVTDQLTGEPIAGAVVEAFRERINLDTAVSNAGFRSRTDSLGNYTIPNLPAGDYFVLSSAEEYLPEFYKEAARKENAEIVSVTDDTDISGIDFTLEPGGKISGLVASATDSSVISGALIRVWEAETGFHRRAYSGNTGFYSVHGLRSGMYYVQVIAEGFESEIYDDAEHRGEATLVEVQSPNETTDIDFYLEPKVDRRGSIIGSVISDFDEMPLHGAVIVAVSAKHRIPHITFTGPRGHYKLTNLPGGRYYVFAWAEGFIGEFYKDARRFKNADAVHIIDGQITAGINFGLAPVKRKGIYTIRGKIRGADSDTGLRGVLVNARLGNDVEVNTVTDINGEFMITGLPAGDYTIEATGTGYLDGYFGGSNQNSAASVSVGGGQDAEDIDLNLEIDTATSVSTSQNTVPESFALLQNYPNPFNPETTIRYQLPAASDVKLRIYNLLGQEIRTLVDGNLNAGEHSVVWDARDDAGSPVASGIYIFRMQVGDNVTLVRRMLLLK